MATVNGFTPPSPSIENDSGHMFIAMLTNHSNGLSDKQLADGFPNMNTARRVATINKLLQQDLLEILSKGKTLLYRLKDPMKRCNIKGADNEEKVVYSIIEEGGNKGIWIRDIRFKSNLMMTQLNKILKNLETKKLIKAVKSVNASKKKVYMLFNLEPDRSITGGAWYQDQDFESEFVEVLNQQCLRFLLMKRESSKHLQGGPISVRNMSYASVKEVHKFISDLGISKVSLDLDDLETILNTIVYDGKAERTVSLDHCNHYRAVESIVQTPGLVSSPCGLCPVINKCASIGLVTPKSCDYLTDWLS